MKNKIRFCYLCKLGAGRWSAETSFVFGNHSEFVLVTFNKAGDGDAEA